MNVLKPQVSIIITNYNYADYLKESIESALSQTYSNIDITLIDDASTDGSHEIYETYKDKIKIIEHKKNQGIIFSRNEALESAKGEFIIFLDADDYFDNDYVEKMIHVAEKYDADVVYPNWRLFGDSNSIMEFSEFHNEKLIRQEIHCTSESLIRRSAVGDHKFESEKVAEDWDFFIGLSLGGRKFKLAKKCYINYRIKGNSRGNSRSYLEDLYYFYDILVKWSKKYPGKINPIELPIYVIKTKDKQISEQEALILQKDEQIADQQELINIKDKQIADQQELIRQKDERLNRFEKTIPYKFYKVIKRVK